MRRLDAGSRAMAATGSALRATTSGKASRSVRNEGDNMHAARLVATAFAIAVGSAALAQGSDHSHHTATAAASPMTEGEVRKVDRPAAKITLKHGEIKAHDMPAMTMVFPVRDKALLDNVKAGDRVRFSLAGTDGRMIVTAIEPAR
jgi:Cu/Ag efflux protein CusF